MMRAAVLVALDKLGGGTKSEVADAINEFTEADWTLTSNVARRLEEEDA